MVNRLGKFQRWHVSFLLLCDMLSVAVKLCLVCFVSQTSCGSLSKGEAGVVAVFYVVHSTCNVHRSI